MEKVLAHNKETDLCLNKEEVKLLLENEIVSRYFYQNGRIEASFNDDPDILSAIKALKAPQVYQSMLSRTYTP